MRLHTYLAISFLTFVVSVYTYSTTDSSDRIKAKISIVGTILSIVFAVTVVCVSIFGNAKTNTETTSIYKVDGKYIVYTGEHNKITNVYVETSHDNYRLKSLNKVTFETSSDGSAYLKSITNTRSLGPLVITEMNYVIVLPNNDGT